MERESKLTYAPHRGITSLWFLTLLLIGVTLGPNRAEAQPFAYVANNGSGTASVINTATNPPIVVQGITVESGPYGVAITPDGKHTYVTNSGSDTVSVIDTSNNTVIATVTLPAPPPLAFCNCPYGIAITPDGSRAYVANQSSESVSVITTSNNMVLTTVTLPVGSFPFGVAITPDGNRAYVANSSSDMVSVIDTNPANTLTFNTVIANVNLTGGSFPFWVAITPDGSRAYVTNLLSNTVSVITTSDNMVAATVNLPVGSFPQGIAIITPDGSRAYVANTGLGMVSVIDTTAPVDTNPATIDTIADIPVGSGPYSGPFGVAITPLSSIVPFSALTAKVEIEKHEIELKATFTLGAGSNGINPLTEDVSFQVGTFSPTIPAGSFKFHPAKSGKGKGKGKGAPAQWTFEGVIDGVKLEAKITDLGGGSFEFKAEAKGANLTGTANPVQVEIIIGNDGESITVTPKFD